jgi:hypothetical protein
MRLLFGCLAVLLGAVSVLLAARYGYKGADTTVDGLISEVVFGAIALCACLFDAAAVRLWFMRHHAGSLMVGLIAVAALIVTFTNSLGAIAGRADSTQAERMRAKADQADDRAELARITRERNALSYSPTTDDAVRAAREVVITSEHIRVAECGNGDARQRGPNCRQRETEEQGKRDALVSVLANKALTERAAQLDADAARVRAKLARAPRVQNANPLGAVLEQMIGATAVALAAWQQAVVAAVFELCLVGVMVIYELLAHVNLPSGRVDGSVGEMDSPLPAVARPETTARATTAISPKNKIGSVKTLVRDKLFPAAGERTEIKALMRNYRAWCDHRGCEPLALRAFLDEIEKLCRKLGIAIEVGDDQRVYCVGVRLGGGVPAAVH